jgi:uncharacterized membrane protein (TIGR02234 family)
MGDRLAGSAKRSYQLTLILLALGAAALFLGYGRTWSTTTVAESGLPSLVVVLSGRDVQPAGAATAIVALAAIAGLVATRRLGRIISGAILILVGAADLFLALRFAGGDRSAVVAAVSEKAGMDLDPARVAAQTVVTIWWLVTAFGALCLLTAGVMTLIFSRQWPLLGSRYERDGSPGTVRTRSVSAWEQLDEGIDPTIDRAEDSPST